MRAKRYTPNGPNAHHKEKSTFGHPVDAWPERSDVATAKKKQSTQASATAELQGSRRSPRTTLRLPYRTNGAMPPPNCGHGNAMFGRGAISATRQKLRLRSTVRSSAHQCQKEKRRTPKRRFHMHCPGAVRHQAHLILQKETGYPSKL